MGLEQYGLTEDLLDSLSYKSHLDKSLRKTTLHKVEKEVLLEEIQNVIDFYLENEIFDTSVFDELDYRIKSMDSCIRKYQRYYPNKEKNKVFNDILGFRIIVPDYEEIFRLDLSLFDVVDMTSGKAQNDGYRGIHLYYKKTNFHYPIEIQINTSKDRQFADWTHLFIYKYEIGNATSLYLRTLYDDGKIKDIEQFKEVLENVLSSGETF